MKQPAERVAAWEDIDSEDRPTFKQAQRLADVLHVPFGYLFLASAPQERTPLPDLRTRQRQETLVPSPDFLEVMYDALRKQEWYRDYLLAQDAPAPAFVGSFGLDAPPSPIAEHIRRTLRINDDLRRSAKDGDDYFRLIVKAAERVGVTVLRNGVVGNNTHRPLDADEFQGFAMSDAVAPLVFVNQNDYLSAQLFTLLHELAHIWMGNVGLSDPEYLARPENRDAVQQRLADQVAAEALVPSDEFLLRWDDYNANSTSEILENLRRHYKVSVFVLLRRAYDLGKILFPEFRREYDRQRNEIKPKRGGGGGYNSIFSRNSVSVTTAILHSVVSGNLGASEGSVLLNVRAATLYRMERHLASVP
jgi:Zn-dependent peptidase ImmA (M78 family)